MPCRRRVFFIHSAAERNCLKIPNRLRTKVPLVRKTGRRRPILPFCDTETPDPDAPLAIFQTVSLGNPMNKLLAYAPIRKCPEAGRVVRKGVQVDHSA